MPSCGEEVGLSPPYQSEGSYTYSQLEIGQDLGPSTEVLALARAQTSPQAAEYEETIRD